MPVHIPALKISPIIWQLPKEISNANNATTCIFFIAIEFKRFSMQLLKNPCQ
jgi:hypothetical protein